MRGVLRFARDDGWESEGDGDRFLREKAVTMRVLPFLGGGSGVRGSGRRERCCTFPGDAGPRMCSSQST